MAIRAFLVASVLLSFLAATCYGIQLTDLQKSLSVKAVPTKDLLRAGVDNITLSWTFDTSFDSSSYKTLKFKLCFSKESQKDRGWRKTEKVLKKDKTCQFVMAKQPFDTTINTHTEVVEKDVPTAKYFIRVYAYNSAGVEVAYGENTDATRTENLFNIQAISGRHITLDICSVCFSAFSVISLFGFFFMEKRKAKQLAAQQK